MQFSGLKNATFDGSETNTEKNRVFDGGWQITASGRTLDELYAEEDARVAASTSVPSVESSADADEEDGSVESGGDYSPDMAADEFLPEVARKCLLDQFSRPDGSVSRKLAKHFLHVSGDPEDPDSYESALPLSVVDLVSQLVRPHPQALDEGSKWPVGHITGLQTTINAPRVEIEEESRVQFRPRTKRLRVEAWSVNPEPKDDDEELLRYDDMLVFAHHRHDRIIRKQSNDSNNH